MDATRLPDLAPPRNLRPAQLGIVLLGKVIVGHIGATLTDLAYRGFVGLQEVPGDSAQDCLMTDRRGQASTSGVLLPFETALLDGLFAGQAELHMRRLGPELVTVLGRVRVLIRRDAVRHGWLWRLRPGHRTRKGEQLLGEIQTFRQQLRVLAQSGGLAKRSDLEPYAFLFGLVIPDVPVPIEEEQEPEARRLTKGPLFHPYLVWQQTCDLLPHRLGREGASGGFVHQWSAPAGHSHTSGAGHDSHGGYGSYGGHSGGGHGGGYGGGGHGH
jgi:hypothetical protein